MKHIIIPHDRITTMEGKEYTDLDIFKLTLKHMRVIDILDLKFVLNCFVEVFGMCVNDEIPKDFVFRKRS